MRTGRACLLNPADAAALGQALEEDDRSREGKARIVSATLARAVLESQSSPCLARSRSSLAPGWCRSLVGPNIAPPSALKLGSIRKGHRSWGSAQPISYAGT